MSSKRVLRIIRDLKGATIQELSMAMEVLVTEVPQIRAALTGILSATEPGKVMDTSLGLLHRNSDIQIKNYAREHKIPIIKVIRQHTGCGLKEAKEASESSARRLLHDCNLRCKDVFAFCQDLRRAGADAVLV